MNILRKTEAAAKVGIGVSKINYMVQLGSFPKPIKLGDGNNSIGWVEHELDDWIQAQIDKRDSAGAL